MLLPDLFILPILGQEVPDDVLGRVPLAQIALEEHWYLPANAESDCDEQVLLKEFIWGHQLEVVLEVILFVSEELRKG